MRTAFEQIRHHRAADIAVSLRPARAFSDIANIAQLPTFAQINAGSTGRGRMRGPLADDDLIKLHQRLAALESTIAFTV